jgi:hypothetical protein
MELESALVCSQDPATGSHFDPNELRPSVHFFTPYFFKFNVYTIFHLHLGSTTNLYFSGFAI